MEWIINKRGKFKTAVNVAIYIALALVIGFSLAITVLLFKPYNEVYYFGGAIKPAAETVVQGGKMTFIIPGYCNNGQKTQVTRKIKNDTGAIYLLPLEFEEPPKKTCFNDIASVIQIPFDVPPGKWRFEVQNTYNPNVTFRAIEVSNTSEEFEITPDPDAPIPSADVE